MFDKIKTHLGKFVVGQLERRGLTIVPLDPARQTFIAQQAILIASQGREIDRLRTGIDRIGFYFAGNEQYQHVSARCLSLIRGETIDEACRKAWESKTPQAKNDAIYNEFSDNPQR